MKNLLILCIISLLFCCGCHNNYFRMVDGVSNSLGIYLPDESNLKINILEYLSGEKVSVRDASKIKYSYNFISTNNYFGLIHVNEQRHSEIEVTPTTNQEIIQQ